MGAGHALRSSHFPNRVTRLSYCIEAFISHRKRTEPVAVAQTGPVACCALSQTAQKNGHCPRADPGSIGPGGLPALPAVIECLTASAITPRCHTR
jgi:hypothetical protein